MPRAKENKKNSGRLSSVLPFWVH